MDLIESMKRGMSEHFKNNPYAEWYLNTLRIPNSPTQKYHKETYGENFSYDQFVPIFNNAMKEWNPNEWVELFKKIGARYVVLTTKHSDGFLLWPSKQLNPKKQNYFASRDIVGELTEAVKEGGLKMGFYYCTAWDWTFNLNPIKNAQSFLENYINPPDYTDYVNNHIYELIDNYNPIILWADMGYPPGTNLLELFAYFYNKQPLGVINDRWKQLDPDKKKFSKLIHYDFLTPEYEISKKIKKKKWETCRGIGTSFGYNKFETEEDYLSGKELIHMFVDIVSKNGNLLLNIGPKPNGKIPELQKKVLLELGKWLDINHEAIFETRPWRFAESMTQEGIEVRFTHKNKILYAIILGTPQNESIIIKNIGANNIFNVKLLGYEGKMEWDLKEQDLRISFPKKIIDSPAISFKISL
jgi:alpha-L-fucosidase